MNGNCRAATKIHIEDPPLPSGIVLLSAYESNQIDRLNAGSAKELRTVLRPTETGPFVLRPSKIVYAPDYDSEADQIGYSTATTILVLTTQEYLVQKILLMASGLSVIVEKRF